MSGLEPFGVAGVGIYALKKGIDGFDRLFGPMADEVAEALRRWTAYRLRNVGRVIEQANDKVSDHAVASSSFPHRAVMKLLEEAGTADDNVVRDYVSGALASSLTPDGKNDRAVSISSLISRMSSFDLRTHHIFYSAFRGLLTGNVDLNVYDSAQLQTAGKILLPYSDYFAGMDFQVDGDPQDGDPNVDVLYDSIVSLRQENLAEVERAGARNHIIQQYPGAAEGGIVMNPTVEGLRLYMWAIGCGGTRPVDDFVKPDLPSGEIEGVRRPTSATLIHGTSGVMYDQS